jgi:tripartite-type tricarboxylate transporter receptor subunit TctC
MAPFGTPSEIVARLQSEIALALKSPEGTKRMREDGALLIGDTPQEFASFIAKERARWSEVVKKAKINVD